MSPTMPLWAITAIAILGAFGGVTGLLALLNLGKTRQKMDVDAAKVVTDAATALVAPLSARVEGHRSELAAQKATHELQLAAVNTKVDELRADLEAWDQAADEHSPWDVIAQHELNRAGINIGPMPPVRPKRRRHPTGPMQTVTVTVESPAS